MPHMANTTVVGRCNRLATFADYPHLKKSFTYVIIIPRIAASLQYSAILETILSSEVAGSPQSTAGPLAVAIVI